MNVTSVEYIPTGLIIKQGKFIKILNRLIEFKFQKKDEDKFLDITIKNKKSKTFIYFMNLYMEKKKINREVWFICSYNGGKKKLGYSGTLYGMSVIGFDDNVIKLKYNSFFIP